MGGWNLADTFGASNMEAVKSGLVGAVSSFAFTGVADAIGGTSWAQTTSTSASTPIGGTSVNGVGFAALVAAQGTVGGINAVLQGGEFQDGFAAAGLSKLASPFLPDTGIDVGHIDVGEVAVAATIGGTASHISGGKFANGAITGAFVNIFNQQDALERGGGDTSSDRDDSSFIRDFLGEHLRGALSVKAGFVLAGTVKVNVTPTGDVSVYLGGGLGAGLDVSAEAGVAANLITNKSTGQDHQGGFTTDLGVSGGFGGHGSAGFQAGEGGVTGSSGVGTGAGASVSATAGYTWNF